MLFLNKIKKNKGFTVLELLVVVAIIGILSAIIMASLNSSRSKGRDAKRIEELRQMVNALELYYNVNGVYPSRAQLYSATNQTQANNPLAPYLWPLPRDPRTGAFYNYSGIRQTTTPVTSSCAGYHLGASLENNNQVLQNDSDFVSTTTTNCRQGPNGTGSTFTDNGVFSGADNQTGNNRFKYDIRR